MLLAPGLPLDLKSIKGGVHSATLNLLTGFLNMDLKVRALIFSRETKEKKVIQFSNNVEIVYIPEGKYSFHTLNYLLSGPKKLKAQITEFNPDIIHYEEGNSFLLTKLGVHRKQKIILTIHGMSFFEAKLKKRFKDKLTWYLNGLLQVMLLPANLIHLSKFSLKMYDRKKLENQEIIQNAVVDEYFQLSCKKNTENKLLYIGVIDPNKNLLYLLKALNELINKKKIFTLDILGGFINEEYETIILNYIRDNKIDNHVKLHGWVSQTEVLKYVAAADILVVSSNHESLPMVIAESMAAGKVVVASAVGGIPEMISDKHNGFIFNLSESDGMVNILSGLYNNNVEINVVSQQARKNALQTYHAEQIAEKTLKFYNRVLIS